MCTAIYPLGNCYKNRKDNMLCITLMNDLNLNISFKSKIRLSMCFLQFQLILIILIILMRAVCSVYALLYTYLYQTYFVDCLARYLTLKRLWLPEQYYVE